MSRLAWASLFLGILANLILPVVASIPGVICGHLALRAMRRDPALLGRKSAVTGLVLGYLSLIAAALLTALWVIFGPLLWETLSLWRQLY